VGGGGLAVSFDEISENLTVVVSVSQKKNLIVWKNYTVKL
jgi:hypothetical protein